MTGTAHAGRFHGTTLHDGTPVSVGQWRVTTASSAVARGISALLGGFPERSLSPESPIQVLTESSVAIIVVPGVEAVSAEIRLKGIRVPVRQQQDIASLPIADLRSHAGAGASPYPRAVLDFRLLAAPQLGLFRYVSSSWAFAESLQDLTEFLRRCDGAVRATLRLCSEDEGTDGTRYVGGLWIPTVSVDGRHRPSSGGTEVESV